MSRLLRAWRVLLGTDETARELVAARLWTEDARAECRKLTERLEAAN